MNSELQSQRKRFSVLIVDDEPANIDLLRGILSPYYDIKVAPSGIVALKIVETRMSRNCLPEYESSLSSENPPSDWNPSLNR